MKTKTRFSTSDHLKSLARHIAELVQGLESIAASNAATDIGARLKLLDALLKLKKAMLETRLLEEDLHERMKQRPGKGKANARRAGISAEALEEIGRFLGLIRPETPPTATTNPEDSQP
jgi:hypothetical protein